MHNSAYLSIYFIIFIYQAFSTSSLSNSEPLSRLFIFIFLNTKMTTTTTAIITSPPPITKM